MATDKGREQITVTLEREEVEMLATRAEMEPAVHEGAELKGLVVFGGPVRSRLADKLRTALDLGPQDSPEEKVLRALLVDDDEHAERKPAAKVGELNNVLRGLDPEAPLDPPVTIELDWGPPQTSIRLSPRDSLLTKEAGEKFCAALTAEVDRCLATRGCASPESELRTEHELIAFGKARDLFNAVLGDDR